MLTGIPKGLIPGFTNFTGPVQADMLRLNTSIRPTAKRLGQHPRRARRRPRRVPERPQDRRRRRHRRAARAGRADLPARRPELQGGRGRQDHYRRPDQQEREEQAAWTASRTWASRTTATTTRRDERTNAITHAAGPSGPGSVVLDIGPGTGALVLYTPPACDGAEIEISPGRPGGASAPTPRSASVSADRAAPTRSATARHRHVTRPSTRALPAGRYIDLARRRHTGWAR